MENTLQHIENLWKCSKSKLRTKIKIAHEKGWSDDKINSDLKPQAVDLADWLAFRKEAESSTCIRVRSGGADVTRADLWIKGHKNKKGRPHSDEIARVVEKINECQMRSSTSTSQSINKDPIAQAFGPEHQGRVRGLGFGVTPTSVRATTQSSILVRKLQGDFQRLEEKHEQLAELVRSQQMPPSSRQQQNNPPNLRGKKCKIFDWLCTSKLVAEGEIETDDPMHLVDGIPIGGGAYLVYVERVFEPNAFLWRNQNNWTTLDNALGEIIPWPKETVARRVLELEKKRKHRNFKKNEFIVPVRDSNAYLDTFSMPMLLTYVAVAIFCHLLMRLLYTVVDSAQSESVLSNCTIALGDLAVRFPNLLEPWTENMYARLRDPSPSVRKNAVLVLSHLILNDMTKDRQLAGQRRLMAGVTGDPDFEKDVNLRAGKGGEEGEDKENLEIKDMAPPPSSGTSPISRSSSRPLLDLSGAAIQGNFEERYPTIILPNQYEDISHLALDIGGSLIKLVYFSRHEDRPVDDKRKRSLKQRLGLRNGNRRSYPILGGRLHFVKFETTKINECLDFINSKQLHRGGIDPRGWHANTSVNDDAIIKVADDAQGRGILDELEADGVDTSYLVSELELPTALNFDDHKLLKWPVYCLLANESLVSRLLTPPFLLEEYQYVLMRACSLFPAVHVVVCQHWQTSKLLFQGLVLKMLREEKSEICSRSPMTSRLSTSSADEDTHDDR
ncbi:hypothetical protein Sjap_019976 [Stephania japonica]|uniref:Condensin complex subunit 1 C-terminal domain-containing protein n=1 Tax=Stephania japonica TaxID=461633 RepID=A0AAP0F5C7_9MAGN